MTRAQVDELRARLVRHVEGHVMLGTPPMHVEVSDLVSLIDEWVATLEGATSPRHLGLRASALRWGLNRSDTLNRGLLELFVDLAGVDDWEALSEGSRFVFRERYSVFTGREALASEATLVLAHRVARFAVHALARGYSWAPLVSPRLYRLRLDPTEGGQFARAIEGTGGDADPESEFLRVLLEEGEIPFIGCRNQECSRAFVVRRRQARYCSDACRRRAAYLERSKDRASYNAEMKVYLRGWRRGERKRAPRVGKE